LRIDDWGLGIFILPIVNRQSSIRNPQFFMVRFILLDTEEDFGTNLRTSLLGLDGVRIVAEVDQITLVPQVVSQVAAEVLFVNLDPDPSALLGLAGEMAATHPKLAVFTTSLSTDGGLILDVMRRGIKEFFPKPIEADALAAAVQKVASQRRDAPPHGRLITISSASGGQGSTMLAVNLAVELAELSGGKVAVVDLDFRFGQVATLLDIDPTYTLADLVGTVEQVEQSVIEKVLVKHDSGVFVLSRPTHLGQTETLSAASCVGVLSMMMRFMDYVIVDGPMRFDIGAKAVLDLADTHLILVQCLVPSVRNALRVLDAMRTAGYKMDRLHLVCNRVGRESSHVSFQDVTNTLNLKADIQIPDDWVTVGGAMNLGVPLLSYGPKSKVRLAINELAKQLHLPKDQADPKDGSKKSLMSRMFSS